MEQGQASLSSPRWADELFSITHSTSLKLCFSVLLLICPLFRFKPLTCNCYCSSHKSTQAFFPVKFCPSHLWHCFDSQIRDTKYLLCSWKILTIKSQSVPHHFQVVRKSSQPYICHSLLPLPGWLSCTD